MKSLFYPALILLAAACSPVKNADKRASKNEIQNLYPQQAFDSLSAKKMLTYGTATIKGIIFKKTNKMTIGGGKTYGTGVKITLYPVTPYFMEWYELREKKEDKRTHPTLLPGC